MAKLLFDNGTHKCIVFNDLVESGSDSVQSNQFAIINDGQCLLLDPGGNLTYKRLLAELAGFCLPSHTRYVFASHSDPDIIASINGWLMITDAQVVIAREWVRFVPHFCVKGATSGRLMAIPPCGMPLELGEATLEIVPAHYLHTVGLFQIYDPVSKILFSGDVGASLVDGEMAAQPVTDFERHLEEGRMAAFHRRYMTDNKACRLWANMVRQMDVDWIVPQHGRSFRGREMVTRFLDWIESLQCGTDLIDETDFSPPGR